MRRCYGVVWMAAALFGCLGGASADEPLYENAFTGAFLASPGVEEIAIRGQQPEGRTGGKGSSVASCVCDPPWTVYGEGLYLRPGNDKVAYAVQIDGAIVPPFPGAPPVQVGLESVVDRGFTPGFRFGAERALNSCSKLGAEVTWLDGSQSGTAAGTAALPLRSLVNHPGTVAAPTDFLAATANSQLDFQLGDVFYRRYLFYDESSYVSCLVGARYAHLDETFHSTFTNAAVAETVDTSVSFDGGGLRFGLDAEQRSYCRNWLVYGKGYASFVGGQFRGRYAQADSVRGLVVNTGWSEDRVVSILETEVGVGWVNPCGNLRITAGYMFAGWFNLINTDDLIRAVRTNDSVNVRDSLSFDGLVVRAELRF